MAAGKPSVSSNLIWFQMMPCDKIRAADFDRLLDQAPNRFNGRVFYWCSADGLILSGRRVFAVERVSNESVAGVSNGKKMLGARRVDFERLAEP